MVQLICSLDFYRNYLILSSVVFISHVQNQGPHMLICPHITNKISFSLKAMCGKLIKRLVRD